MRCIESLSSSSASYVFESESAFGRYGLLEYARPLHVHAVRAVVPADVWGGPGDRAH